LQVSKTGVAPEFFGDVEAMSSAAAEGLSGLLDWSEPIIFDRLRDAYFERLRDFGAALSLARAHSRVWRALIEGDMGRFSAQRTALTNSLYEHGLSLDCLAEADAQTMTELVEVVVSRFRRSPRLAQGYHLALIQLASRLGPTARAA
jgi:hypothetical protein